MSVVSLYTDLFLHIRIFHSIFNFGLNALCCVSLEAGEEFALLFFGKFWDYFVGKKFFIKVYIGIAIIWFSFRVLIMVDVSWTGFCNVYVRHSVVSKCIINPLTPNDPIVVVPHR